jgi:hypothetical protein
MHTGNLRYSKLSYKITTKYPDLHKLTNSDSIIVQRIREHAEFMVLILRHRCPEAVLKLNIL